MARQAFIGTECDSGIAKNYRPLEVAENETIRKFRIVHEDGKLGKSAAIKNFLITAAGGKAYEIKHHVLQAGITQKFGNAFGVRRRKNCSQGMQCTPSI
jgi:hypothetical protein